jgi:hypothetical protein
MRPLIVIVQIVLGLIVTAGLMPVVLATLPAARNERFGVAMAAGIFVLSFVLIAMVWPKGKPKTDRRDRVA